MHHVDSGSRFTGEGDHVDERVRNERGTDHVAGTEDAGKNALWQFGVGGEQLEALHGDGGRQAGGLYHAGVAAASAGARERTSNVSGQFQGVITATTPTGSRITTPWALSPRASNVRRPRGEPRVVLDHIRRSEYLRVRFGDRLALLAGEQHGEPLAVFPQALGEVKKHPGAHLPVVAPARVGERVGSPPRRLVNIGNGRRANRCDWLLSRGVGIGKRLPAGDDEALTFAGHFGERLPAGADEA